MRIPTKAIAHLAAMLAVVCYVFTLGVIWMPVAANAQTTLPNCDDVQILGSPCIQTPAPTPTPTAPVASTTTTTDPSGDSGLIAGCVRSADPGKVPGLPCVMDQIVLIGRYLFQIMGSVALLFFVTGGFMIITATGPEGVKKGKAYLTNATIGIIIILTAGYIVQFGVNLLRAGYQEGSSCAGIIYEETPGQPLCCTGRLVPAGSGSGFTCQSTGAK